MTQYFGRKRIFSDIEPTTNNIPEILNKTLLLHDVNAQEMKYLIDYFTGNQPILDRVKTVRSDINNKIVFNNAWAIVRDITGYFMGTPVQYTPKVTEKMKQINEFNNYMDLESRPTVDKEVQEFASICGVGYKCTIYDLKNEENEVPFSTYCLSPLTTYIVYGIDGEEKLGVNFTDYIASDDTPRRRIRAYSRTAQYTYDISVGSQVQASDIKKEPTPTLLDRIPIVEYRNNQWLIGDFEVVLSLLDAINTLGSNSLDDVEQVVQSILLLFGIPEEQHESIADLSNGDVLVFNGIEGINQDGKYISAPLDGTTVAELRAYLEEAFKMIAGIPDRKTRGGGGGDTGDAVKLRDGWADIELVARNKELLWRQAEIKSIRLALKILNSKNLLSDLAVSDVDIKFSRNKNDNLQSKVTAGAALYNMGVAEEDIVAAMDITTDTGGFVERWKKARDEKQQKALDMMQKQTDLNGEANNKEAKPKEKQTDEE